ncbi:MAG: hypothetical protein LUI87_10795 [Lachnospiraceae bacterium]|nr:hypothetical protein [Lachnospiraceae bacterium]
MDVDMMDLAEIMEAEEITEKDVQDIDEIEHFDRILPMEVSTEVPGMEQAVICGDPIRLGGELDFQQGFDNPYGAFGTCGLNAIANICYIGGKDVSEVEVVEYAMENDLCTKDDPGFHGGGTTIGQQLKILEHYGFPSHCEFSNVADSERLAEAVEGGHGVLLGLNSGLLQDREWKIYNDDGEITATHAVCLTGTVRDAETGELRGFYLCDSSSQNPEGGRTFLTLDAFRACYSDVQGSYAVITDKPIRGMDAVGETEEKMKEDPDLNPKNNIVGYCIFAQWSNGHVVV